MKKNIYEKASCQVYEKNTHVICLKLRLPSQAWSVPLLVIYSNRFKLYLTLQHISLQKFLGRERGVQMIFTEMIDPSFFISYERHVGDGSDFQSSLMISEDVIKEAWPWKLQRHAGLNHTHTMPCFFFRAALWTQYSNFPLSTQAANRREGLRSAVLQRRLFKMLTCCHGRCSGLWAKRKMRVIPHCGQYKAICQGKEIRQTPVLWLSMRQHCIISHRRATLKRPKRSTQQLFLCKTCVCTDVCVCVCACIHIRMCTCVPWYMCGGQRATCRKKFSFCHIVPEMEFRSSLAANGFIHWAVSLAQCAQF